MNNYFVMLDSENIYVLIPPNPFSSSYLENQDGTLIEIIIFIQRLVESQVCKTKIFQVTNLVKHLKMLNIVNPAKTNAPLSSSIQPT